MVSEPDPTASESTSPSRTPEITFESDPAPATSPSTTPPRREPPIATPSRAANRVETAPTPASPTPAPPSATTRSGAGRNSTAAQALEQAAATADGDPVTARASLTRAWLAGLEGIQRDNARRLSRRLADSTLLEVPGRPATPYARPHRVKPNEVLGKIIRDEKVEVNAEFLARINGLRNPNSVRAGRDLWLPEGRFHAVVDLSELDLAVFQETEGRRDLLIVMPVGIGVDGLTPTGLFRVKPGSKSSNPSWTDPASGRTWKSNDPGNPIGEHWIGLQPVEEGDRDDPAYEGLGLHGTTEPQTVGTRCTNGSLRLLGDDVELLFQILGSGTSTVEIRD
jgi:lipoprotein-anchoring transpeptidase ErfK/SrfK